MKKALIWTCMLAVAPMFAACSAGDELGRSTAAHTQADSGTKDEPDAGPPDDGCTYTQGWYKTHPDEWPVSSLMVGPYTYSKSELLDLLWTPPRGDASLILAHQLITALLNVAGGASSLPAISQGQMWMTTFDPGHELPYGVPASSPAGQLATDIADDLADYNEGRDGPGHCDDVDGFEEPVLLERGVGGRPGR